MRPFMWLTRKWGRSGRGVAGASDRRTRLSRRHPTHFPPRAASSHRHTDLRPAAISPTLTDQKVRQLSVVHHVSPIANVPSLGLITSRAWLKFRPGKKAKHEAARSTPPRMPVLPSQQASRERCWKSVKQILAAVHTGDCVTYGVCGHSISNGRPGRSCRPQQGS